MKCYIKNVSPSSITVAGQIILSGSSVYVPYHEIDRWANDDLILSNVRNGNLQVGTDYQSYLTSAVEGEVYLRELFSEDAFVADGGTVTKFSPVVYTDPTTGKKSVSLFGNMLSMMKELYNEPANPFYESSFQAFIGPSGRETEHLGRTNTLEIMHNGNGWHMNEIKSYGYQKPEDLLIYYGWLNSFNYDVHAWDNEKISQEMAKYNLLVFGDGIQDPGHADYTNASKIIGRVKALNPYAKVFGYVTVNQNYSSFEAKSSQWDDLEIDGIFMDEAGYNYGTVSTNGRDAFNSKVLCIHGQDDAKLCFANSWNPNHILGTAEDYNYSNVTWNPSLNESELDYDDWCLLESFPINTAVYTSSDPDGYSTKADWSSRGVSWQDMRYTYGVNLASVGIINNANSIGQDLFDFQYVSGCMFALEAVGTSDTNYGAGSAQVKFWDRLEISDMGRIWNNTTAVQLDTNDNDKYVRYTDFGKFMLDFSTNAQEVAVEKYHTIFGTHSDLTGIGTSSHSTIDAHIADSDIHGSTISAHSDLTGIGTNSHSAIDAHISNSGIHGGGGGSSSTVTYYAESIGISTTTSTSYQQKVRLTASSLDAGTYRFGWYYEWHYNNANNDFKARVQIDDSSTIMEHQQEPKDVGSDQNNPDGGFRYKTLSSGTHNIDLDYCGSGGQTATIKNASLELWKITTN